MTGHELTLLGDGVRDAASLIVFAGLLSRAARWIFWRIIRRRRGRSR